MCVGTILGCVGWSCKIGTSTIHRLQGILLAFTVQDYAANLKPNLLCLCGLQLRQLLDAPQ